MVGIDDGVGKLHFLQLDKAAQRGKDVVQYGHCASHLKPLDVANLHEHAVVLLNLSVLVVHRLEVSMLERFVGICIGQANHVMAQLVF